MMFVIATYMKSETLTLRSDYDDLDISVLMIKPEGKAHAVLQISHGMRGCKERFLGLMEYLAAHGIACVTNDHRGHGESVRVPEDIGYMYSGGDRALVEDLRMVTQWCMKVYPDTPIFLLGHSMGSLAVRSYMRRYDNLISGVILCGSPSHTALTGIGIPMIGLLNRLHDGRIRTDLIQKVISDIYNIRFASEGRDAWTCSDPDVRAAFASDPKSRQAFTANASLALMHMMKDAYSSGGWALGNPHMPIYFMSGADDPCMRGERRFHKSVLRLMSAGYDDITSAIFPYMRHEILNETGKETVWNDILHHLESWIKNGDSLQK